jgi:F-type H+-transporting ATPase subunit a
MTNLFSSFDPTVRIINLNLSLNWAAALIIRVLLPQTFWVLGSQWIISILKIIKYLAGELEAVFSSNVLPGTIFIYLGLFFFILFSNFIGLFPYIFTSTSHLRITISLGLPLWLGRIIFSVIFQFSHIIAHLVPTGTPGILIPVIVIIETVRRIIRPGTLSIRLAANIVAGHLLLTLLGSQGPNVAGIIILLLIRGLILLLILEVAVACIQAYVFIVLNSLYLRELISVGFNKKII